jgi:hypothetical protein
LEAFIMVCREPAPKRFCIAVHRNATRLKSRKLSQVAAEIRCRRLIWFRRDRQASRALYKEHRKSIYESTGDRQRRVTDCSPKRFRVSSAEKTNEWIFQPAFASVAIPS